MSADRRHGAVDGDFLGRLVARAQSEATQASMPSLQRRRPGIFEPRGPAPADRFDLVETTFAPDRPSIQLSMPPMAQAPSQVLPAPATGAPSPSAHASAPPPTGGLPGQRDPVETSPRIAHATDRTLPLPIPGRTQTGLAAVAAVAARSSRTKPTREVPERIAAAPVSPQPGSTPSKTSRPPAIHAPQSLAARSAGIVRVEQSRVESRTTVVVREGDRHRHAPASTEPAPALKVPARLTSSEAPRTPVAHPVRSAAMSATPAPAAPAPVHVSIGRVEIRGVSGAPASAPPRSAAARPQLGLDEYLRQRHGDKR